MITNRDKKFLNYVAKLLVDTSVIEKETGAFILPSGLRLPDNYLMIRFQAKLIYTAFNFLRVYLKTHFGITDDFEAEYVFEKYWYGMKEKLLKERGLNESENKNNKLYNFIVDDLVSRSSVNKETLDVTFPNGKNVLYYPLLSCPSLYYPNNIFFLTYCRDVYGLKDEEIERLWQRYWHSVKRKVERITLNESENKNNKLYNFIVDDFIRKHCKFGDPIDNPTSYKGHVVDMYIDHIVDYHDSWRYDSGDIEKMIERKTKNKITVHNETSQYFASIYYRLSNYGLSLEEVREVYEMILYKILDKLNELNNE